MNEQELRAEFEVKYCEEYINVYEHKPDTTFLFDWCRIGCRYTEFRVEIAYQMYKRANFQSEQRIAEIESAITKMIKCKGRYHTEQNTIALAKLVGIELPPKEHPEPSYEELKAENERLKKSDLWAVYDKDGKQRILTAYEYIKELLAENERLKAAQTWQPIETAPRDGRPVWVRGSNYGDKSKGVHACWAWFDADGWRSVDFSENGQSKLMYLTDWMPQPQKDELL